MLDFKEASFFQKIFEKLSNIKCD